MSEEEAQQLRAKLSEIYQQPYEDCKAYGRSFNLAAQRAYSEENVIHPMVQEQLVRLFISGLRDEQVRHDVFANRPATLEAAVNAASAAAHTVALAGLPSRSDRRDEPMDIGALPPPPTSMLKDSSVSKLEKQISTMRSEIDMLREKQTHTGGNRDAPPHTMYVPPPMPTQYPMIPPQYYSMYALNVRTDPIRSYECL